MKIKAICAALLTALSLSLVLPACARDNNKENIAESGVVREQTQTEQNELSEEPVASETPQEEEAGKGQPEEEKPEAPAAAQPKIEKISYLKVTGSGVNIRKGAGSGYASLGVAERDTLFADLGRYGNWYKTTFKGKEAYIYADYCSSVSFEKSANDAVERVITEGCKYMGVEYVYGATRYMDGNGNRLSGFTATAFDCSSLMQYIFKMGAGINLQVNTRTQIYQGTTVKSGELRRGDLMFFTNASRRYNTGIERVGHVALYLGDDYILHTASDYAKIEKISSTRWSYFIQAQRML